VRWKRDAILRCNDGYGLRMAARAGAGLLLQPEVLVAEELASGRLVRVLEPFTPRRGRCIYCGVRIYVLFLS
jgi:DNA-binding transcriptional LysR family regulator